MLVLFLLANIFLGSGNLFGGEFDGYDLKGGEFERGMEDIEVPREAEKAGDEGLHVSNKDGSGNIEVGSLHLCVELNQIVSFRS